MTLDDIIKTWEKNGVLLSHEEEHLLSLVVEYKAVLKLIRDESKHHSEAVHIARVTLQDFK